jgi:hypothetical protein
MVTDDLLLTTHEDTKTMEKPTQYVRTTQEQQTFAPDELLHRHIQALAGEERIDMDKWLFTLNKFYDESNYSSSQRIVCTIKFLNEEQTNVSLHSIRNLPSRFSKYVI